MKIAIVTGASSGIGREFALKLDGLKLDEIWLAALDKSGLDETAAEMTTPARIFAADLTKDGGLSTQAGSASSADTTKSP